MKLTAAIWEVVAMQTKSFRRSGLPVLFAASLVLFLHAITLAKAAVLNAPSPDYPTIQAAVDAAETGDVIRIAPLDFYEQVVIVNKTNLTLVGESGATLHATDGMTQTLLSYGFNGYAVVAVHRSDIIISGLTIAGESLGESYPTPLNGLDLFGASAVVTNCVITGFSGTTHTVTATVGRGVHCFNPVSTGNPAVNVAIVNNTFTNNQIAIHLRGDPGANPTLQRATAKVQGNTITGFGPAEGWNLGIWIVCGVAVEVIGNHISEFSGTGTFDSSGIIAYDAAAASQNRNPKRFVSLASGSYAGNTFSNNGNHLLIVGGDKAQITNNVFIGTAPSPTTGAIFLSGKDMVVANNNFSDLPTAVLLVGDERWNAPWPMFPPAVSPTLTANWFCNVPEPIRADPALVTGIQEGRTQTCEETPLRPIFQSIGKDTAPSAPASLVLRSWHDQPVIIEASADFQQWLPIYTNALSLPSFEYQDPEMSSGPRRFYRAREE